MGGSENFSNGSFSYLLEGVELGSPIIELLVLAS